MKQSKTYLTNRQYKINVRMKTIIFHKHKQSKNVGNSTGFHFVIQATRFHNCSLS